MLTLREVFSIFVSHMPCLVIKIVWEYFNFVNLLFSWNFQILVGTLLEINVKHKLQYNYLYKLPNYSLYKYWHNLSWNVTYILITMHILRHHCEILGTSKHCEYYTSMKVITICIHTFLLQCTYSDIIVKY